MPAVAFTESEINRAARAAKVAGMDVGEIRIERTLDGTTTLRVLCKPLESVETQPKETPEPWT